MDTSWMVAPALLLLVLLLEGVQVSATRVSCYKCSYYTHGDNSLTQDCIEVTDCVFCQTRVYQSDSTELVQRDCVARCLSSGVPVMFQNIKDVSANEICCQTDLCNSDPSSATTSTRPPSILIILPPILLSIMSYHQYKTT